MPNGHNSSSLQPLDAAPGLNESQDLAKLWNVMIPVQLRQDPNLLREASRVAAISAVMLFWFLVLTPMYVALGGVASAMVVSLGGLLLTCNLMMLQRGNSPRICGQIICCISWVIFTLLALCNGGNIAPSTNWYVLIPVIALVLCGGRPGVIWTLVAVASVVALMVAHQRGWQFPNDLGPSEFVFLQTSALAAMICCFVMLEYVLMLFEEHARNVMCEANRRLQVQSACDALTGVTNRRGFDQLIQHEWNRHHRERQPLSVVLIDVDFFKQYNDSCGHLAGDNVLRSVAKAVQEGVRRRSDVVARYGGEEFAVVLPHTPQEHLPAIVENIRGEVRKLAIPHPRSSVSPLLTISMGTATVVPNDDATLFDLIQAADEALYRAKESGRDRAEHSAELLAAV